MHRFQESELSCLPFEKAASQWLESRRPFLGARTQEDYRNYIKTLSGVFGEMQLSEITTDQIRAYQKMRLSRAGASIINHECSLIQQMLKRIGCWAEIAHDYQPLSLPKESPHRALSEAEEECLYRMGPQFPQWDVAYCAFVTSINTTAGPGEIRHLRLQDIDVEKRIMRVQPEGAKNVHRIRPIPLSDSALEAVQYLWNRAQKLGSNEPAHYLLPYRVRTGVYDPTKPCKGWRTAHDALLKACDIQVSPYSFRHHAITKLLENPDVSEEVAEALAGHISHQMKKRYSHIRMEARRAAVEALSRVHPAAAAADKTDLVYLSNQQVHEMVEAGLPAKVIAAKIQRSSGNFDTSPEVLKKLKASGVHDSIIIAMVQAS